MKYKIGDKVSVEVEVPKDGAKRLLIREPADNSKIVQGAFLIVSRNETMQTYTIIIDDDMIGWTINAFHVEHAKINKKYLGMKFYDIAESLII